MNRRGAEGRSAGSPSRDATVWISIVVGLLLMVVAIQATLLVFAINDPSFAVEPDYEQKAANWDAVRRAQASSDRLQWAVTLETAATPEPGQVEVRLVLQDRQGRPVVGAEVAFDAFHNARASRIVRESVLPGEPGEYRGTFRIGPSGVWEFRVRAVAGDDVFLGTFRKSVLSLPGLPVVR